MPTIIRKNLVVVRAGDDSLHPQWINDPDKCNFDIFISYYGNTPGRFSEQADYYDFAVGLKWQPLAKYFTTGINMFSNYDACWFPDDDLSADTSTINRMFNLFHEHKLWLAQPALSKVGHINHRITAQVSDARLRFTNFVEIMCPLFSRQAMAVLGRTFNLSISGWGLDYLWPYLLGYPKDRVAILDETPIVHTRPTRTGSFYKQCSKVGIKPKTEMRNLLQNNNFDQLPKIMHKIIWQRSMHPVVEMNQKNDSFLGFICKKQGGALMVATFRGYETRNESTIKMIGQAIEKYKIPDFDWIFIYTGDKGIPQMVKGKRMLGYSTRHQTFNNVCPDFIFDHWHQVQIDDYEKTRKEISQAGDAPPETNMLGWRGNIRTHRSRKILVNLISNDKSNFDIESIRWNRKNPNRLVCANYVSLPQHAKKWRYLIDVEGNGWSARLKLFFFSKRVIFIQERPFKEWYFQHLKAWEHFVPVRRDLSDLLEKLHVIKSDVNLENKIRYNAFVFAQKYLTREAALERWKELLI